MAGALWLAATARVAFPVLSWSDEIVYAVMARNIADGRGLVTGFYDWRALQDGYPQADVHMPGHPLFMSLFFKAFGPHHAAAFAASWVAVLAGAVGVFLVSWRTWGKGAGLTAAGLLFVMPAVTGYAHSTMAEPTVVMVSSLFLFCWWRCDTPVRALAMAGALAAGVLCRETLLVFLLPAAEVIHRAPRDRRGKMLLAFVGGLAAAAPLLVGASLARARFPHALSELPAFGTWAWWSAMASQLADNACVTVPGATFVNQLFVVSLGLALVLPMAAWSVPGGETKRLGRVALALAVAHYAGLAGLYTVKGWHGVRLLVFLAPWLAVLGAGLLAAVPTLVPRVLATTAVMGLLAAHSVKTVSVLADDRRAEQRDNAEVASLFQRLTAGVPIRTVLGYESPWEIGWRRYPVTVVWNVPAGVDYLRRIEQVLPIDAVIGRTPHVMPLAEASDRGELGASYERVRRGPDAQRQVLIRRGLAVP